LNSGGASGPAGVSNLEVPNQMDSGTLVMILIVALVVVVLLFLIRAAGAGRRRPQLRPLAAEARDRYVGEWDEIETKFVDAPEQAVREAEALVMSVLRERGHPLIERDLPSDVQRAHKLGFSSRGDRTEGLRQALLHYRAVMERMVGPEDQAKREQRRRELA
jgi:hypothetical protein